MTRNTTPSPCPSGNQFECRDCLTRFCVDGGLSSCPECGGDVENLSNPRE